MNVTSTPLTKLKVGKLYTLTDCWSMYVYRSSIEPLMLRNRSPGYPMLFLRQLPLLEIDYKIKSVTDKHHGAAFWYRLHFLVENHTWETTIGIPNENDVGLVFMKYENWCNINYTITNCIKM